MGALKLPLNLLNLSTTVIATAPTPATSGTSVVVTAGHGATRLPAVPFMAIAHPANSRPTLDNGELVVVTAKVTDTLTITRAQGGTSARTIIVGDWISAVVTKEMLDLLQTQGLRQTFLGLTVRTHPDNVTADSKVYLDHADEIVMHDGEHVADWDDLTADITVAGAGGLDTGTEGASRWYEIHAIRKSSDGDKKLLLHRAKSYDLDQSFTTTPDVNKSLRLLTGTATDKLAQGITFAIAGSFVFVDVNIKKAGTPTGSIWFTLEASAAGDPSGTPLATSDKIDVSLLSTTTQTVRFVFRIPYSVTVALHYLVMQGDYTRSDTNHAIWVGVIAGGYAGGIAAQYNGTSWIAATGIADFYFKTYVEQNNVAVTMPTGYDQRCHVGWVYNNSASNFTAMSALDRNVFHYSVAVSSVTTSGIMTLTLIDQIVPPVPVRMKVIEIRGSVAGAALSINPGLLGFGNGFGFYYTFPSADTFNDAAIDMPISFQHFYFNTGSGNCFIYPLAYQW